MLPIYHGKCVSEQSTEFKTKDFLIGIDSMQGWTTTTKHGVTRKRSTKRLKYAWNIFGKKQQTKGVC